MQDEYMGVVKLFAGYFVPNGYVECNGQLLNINSFPALHSLLLNTFGGDGITSFGVPDLRGRVPVGRGQGPGKKYEMGDKDGAENIVLSEQQLPAHTHDISFNVSTANGETDNAANNPTLAKAGTGSGRDFAPTKMYNTATPDIINKKIVTIQSTGGKEPVDLRQPFNTMMYIMCANGIMPSRP
jgi:microcystin-dependent protein